MNNSTNEPEPPGQYKDEARASRKSADLAGAATLEYIRDLSLELQRLADRSGCPELASLLAAAAAEAHHQAEARRR